MEIKGISKKLKDTLLKYKYALAVLAVGLVLMLLPTGTKNTPQINEVTTAINEPSASEALCSILKCIRGAGDVRVMLTVSCGEETVYYESEDIETAGESNSVRKNVVTVTDADRNQNALIRYINPEKYLGAVVVCQGADSPQVRENIIDAVSKATGLRSDEISVLKME